MLAHDPKEVHDVAINVVDHLALRALRPAQENASHADEGLRVAAVRDGLDPLRDALGEEPLAADPRRDRLCGLDVLERLGALGTG